MNSKNAGHAGFLRMLLAALCLAAAADAAAIIVIPPLPATMTIDTEILALTLSGTGELPLGMNYGPVQSQVSLNLRTAPGSPGQTTLIDFSASPFQNGNPLSVGSFFDVFFDITVTDVDASRDFGGNIGPTITGSGGPFTRLLANGFCTADTSKPDLGCAPPIGLQYSSFSSVPLDKLDVNLGVDLNSNLELDVLRLTGLRLTFTGEGAAPVPQGGTVLQNFNTSVEFFAAVLDAITDPPFDLTLSGPTSARSGPIFQPQQVPEPGVPALLSLALAGLLLSRSKRA